MYTYNRTAADKIWVYLESSKQFKQMDRDDPKFDWNWPHAPPGSVRMQTRGSAWEYVYFGSSKEEAAEKANQYDLEKIRELEKQLEVVRARLVKP